jgi:hypothetical protein
MQGCGGIVLNLVCGGDHTNVYCAAVSFPYSRIPILNPPLYSHIYALNWECFVHNHIALSKIALP